MRNAKYLPRPDRLEGGVKQEEKGKPYAEQSRAAEGEK